MVDIGFYHLSKSPLEKALAKLLEKALAVEKRAVVLVDTSERMMALDQTLWTYSSAAFLPHGTEVDPLPEEQPVYLTTTLENPNQANLLMVVDGIEIPKFDGFERCFDLFNGLDSTSVEEARRRWRSYKNQGHQLTYWFQSEDGGWEQKKQT